MDTCKTKMDVNDYKRYEPRKHVYERPEMYVGADIKIEREEWFFDTTQGKMVYKETEIVPAVERLFLEILSNASDAVGRSRRKGVKAEKIDIDVDDHRVKIKNYGLTIPIEIHPTEKVYLPEMIFGTLLTGSNFDVERHEVGVNGIGAKATNIFSKEFSVEIMDSVTKKEYKQTWNDNMTKRGEPIIKNYKGKENSVCVSYILDFGRFGYEKYDEEMMSLFARHAIDVSFTAKVGVNFNGFEMDFSSIRDYAELYYGESVKTGMLYYQWPEGAETSKSKKGEERCTNGMVLPSIEMIVLDTPDNGGNVSFVNCMMTKEGGVHVNAAIKASCDCVVTLVNERAKKKLDKINKGKDPTPEQKKAFTLNINDVKKHVSILISVKVVNPKFTSQTKTKLNGPTPKFKITDDIVRNAVSNWKLFSRLEAELEAKQFLLTSKTDGKLKKYIQTEKGTDANQAGKKERAKCLLIVTEGDSGKCYSHKYMTHYPNGRDYLGLLPLRGKGINALKKENERKLDFNSTICELKTMLGLRSFVDYTSDAEFNTLRYGGLVLMADADVDGKHIIGLILAYFKVVAPSLLKRGYLRIYRTPIVRVKKGSENYRFFNYAEYETWKSATPDFAKWNTKYYKGLGSSNDEDIEQDFNNQFTSVCLYDESADGFLDLAFSDDMRDDRKKWIMSWSKGEYTDCVEKIEQLPISIFVNDELIQFCITNVQRSIPSIVDGLKQSQRKIIYAAQKKWNIKIGKKKSYILYKLARFEAYIAEVSRYHYGEHNLGPTITSLAQDFTGSNNLCWFFKDGQFGTRYENGEDASASRYISTYPEHIFPYIIRQEDTGILDFKEDEGCSIEPTHYCPIIPMVLVNGVSGIGTGFSTKIPCHNPIDIINWLVCKINGKTLPTVNPWYRGFTGKIDVVDRRYKKFTKEDLYIIELTKEALDTGEAYELEEEYKLTGRPLVSMISYGTYRVDSSGTIFVTELPIGTVPIRYRKWLEKLVQEKKITGFRDQSMDNMIHFEIYGFDETANIKNLKLKKSFGMSNMVLLNEKNIPTRYDTTLDILEAFYSYRLPLYDKRKQLMLKNAKETVNTCKNKIKFIQAVIDGSLQIINNTTDNIISSLHKLNIPIDVYENSRAKNFSVEDVNYYSDLVAKKEKEVEDIEILNPSSIWLSELEQFLPICNSYLNQHIGKQINVSNVKCPPKSRKNKKH